MISSKRWASWGVSLLALVAMAWLLRQVNWPAAQAAWARVPAWVWLLSAIGLVCSHLLRAGRVRAEWRPTLRMGWREAWGLMVRHSAWVVLVPMRGGEAIYVWVLHRQGGVSLRQASISLLRLRIQDMAVLGGLSVALFAPFSAGWRLMLAMVLMAVAVWVLPVIWQWLLHRVSRQQEQSAFQAPAPAYESWVYAILNWVVKAAAIAWPLWLMLDLPFDAALMGAAGGELAATLPLQPPAGFGPYEAGVIFGVQWAAPWPWTEVAAAALAVHLLALAVTVGSATVARLLGWSQRSLQRLDATASHFED